MESFDYSQLPVDLRLHLLGLPGRPSKPAVLRSFQELAHEMDTYREDPILDTEAATRAKVEKAPYSVQKVGREALKLWIEPLADCLAKGRPLGAWNRFFAGSTIGSSP